MGTTQSFHSQRAPIGQVARHRADGRGRGLGPGVIDRVELYEAAIDSLPDGFALLQEESGRPGEVVFWNRAAVAITGHGGVEVVGRAMPDTLDSLLSDMAIQGHPEAAAGAHAVRGCLAHIRHKLGHQVSIMVRNLPLRDGLGQRIGSGILFHPAEHFDAIPRGDSGEDESVESSQAELETRLEEAFEDLRAKGQSFGVLWIAVDQARDLRKNHGAGACETMLNRVEKILAQGLHPAEFLGRWGQDEFLIVSKEPAAAALSVHAQRLVGLARTTDFRWWGDRIAVTVSIGAAQAGAATQIPDLLAKAQSAMQASFAAGGNRSTSGSGGHACLPS